MIYLGDHDRAGIVRRYVEEHRIRNVYLVGEPIEGVETAGTAIWKDVDKYRCYNVLRTVIRKEDLLVMNEILQSSERNCLKYNCIRQYAVQTSHRLIFQRIPFVSSKDDVAVLHDMTTENPFLKLPMEEVWRDIRVVASMPEVTLRIDRVKLSPAELELYQARKAAIFAKLKGSPCLLPGQCLRESEKIGSAHVGYRWDSKSVFLLDGRYFETETGVDRYYADILRDKARWMSEWRELNGK